MEDKKNEKWCALWYESHRVEQEKQVQSLQTRKIRTNIQGNAEFRVSSLLQPALSFSINYLHDYTLFALPYL